MAKAIRLLLLSAGGSPSINFIKALKTSPQNFYIVGVDLDKYNLHAAPLDKKYLVKRAKGKDKAYVEKLIEIVKKEGINFIHAQHDDEVKILSAYRESFPTKTFLPSKEAVTTSQDKWLTYKKLKDHNVPVARTVLLKNEETLKTVFDKNGDTSWLRASSGYGGKASLPVKNFNQAKMWISYWIDRGLSWNNFLASELLPGREVSWVSIWRNGKLICSQQKERISWVQGHIAPSGVGGTTAIQKTVSYSRINKICTDTIKAIDKTPNGIYVIDTKENRKGVPCVTEINPGRFFTTSLFFPTAGFNMPYIYVQLGMDHSIPKVKSYNNLPDNIYWIRVIDNDPVLVKNGAKTKTWKYAMV